MYEFHFLTLMDYKVRFGLKLWYKCLLIVVDSELSDKYFIYVYPTRTGLFQIREKVENNCA